MGIPKLQQAAEWIFAAITTALACFTIFFSIKQIQKPYEFVYGEGIVLNAALRMLHGLTPYPDPHQWPIVLDPYGPLCYLAAAIPIKLTGLGLTGPRLVSLLSGLGVTLMLILLIRHQTQKWRLAVAFGAMFLCVWPVSLWLVVVRVDMLALFLTVLGLYLFLAYPHLWYLAVLCWVAVMFGKFSMISAPAACVLWLLLRRQWRRAAQVTGLGVALSLAGFAIMQWLSGGHFAFHMFGTHPDVYEPIRYWMLVDFVVLGAPVASVFAVIFLMRAVRNLEVSLLTVYVPMTLLGAATAGKFGSTSNHVLELAAALCLGGGLGWSGLSSAVADSKLGTRGLAAGALVAALLVFHYYNFLYNVQPGCEQAYQFVHASPGQMYLSEDATAVVLAGKQLAVTDPWLFSQLVMHGGWSDEPLREKLRAHAIDYVILGTSETGDLERWTQPVLREIEQNYQPVASFDCSEVSFILEKKQQAASSK